MTTLILTIDGTHINCDVLAREDATDEEIKAAQAFETVLKTCLRDTGAVTKEHDITGDGHERIRKAGNP